MKRELRPELPALPPSIRRLPVDARGFPVPFFVAWIDGKPDHRIVEPVKLMRCVRDGLCWICGRPLQLTLVSVIGPMCGVNHISSEPPSHEACARFAVQACPFLSRPRMRRRDAGLPDAELVDAPGVMLLHNPGVSLLWFSRLVQSFRVSAPKARSHNLLFDVGEPLHVEWWTEGRHATRDEAEQAIAAGLPTLEAQTESDANRAELREQVERLRAWLPSE